MIVIIPARGGSKGLPGKNVKPLLGKPLIAYTIQAALDAKRVSEVIVSTDDEEIAAVSRAHGASVPFMRPEHLATDHAQAIDTYLYTLDMLEKTRSIEIDSVSVLLPTCPLRNAGDIDAAIEKFYTHQADSVVSYTEESHPIAWHKRLDADGRFQDIWPDTTLANRQEYTKTYYPNGAIYVFRKHILLQRKYYTENSFAYVMPRYRSIDIDTLEDFMLAEFYKKSYGQ